MIDDHMMFLQGLKSLLQLLVPAWRVDSADTGAAGLRMAAETSYELVLLDWYLGDVGGAQLIERLRAVGCASRIVVLSGETDTHTIRTMVEQGAAGFIPKRYDSELMLAALDVVVRGGIYLPHEALAELGPVGASRRDDAEALLNPQQRLAGLTPRQIDVYRAAARGLPNKLIARELGIAESTVKTHLIAIYSMLGVRNRTEAAYQASIERIRVV